MRFIYLKIINFLGAVIDKQQNQITYAEKCKKKFSICRLDMHTYRLSIKWEFQSSKIFSKNLLKCKIPKMLNFRRETKTKK